MSFMTETRKTPANRIAGVFCSLSSEFYFKPIFLRMFFGMAFLCTTMFMVL